MKTRILFALSCALTFIYFQKAAAMNCTKATTNYEQIVCSDAKLLAVDKSMSEAFAKAIGSRSADEKAALRLDQKHWLKKTEQRIAVELKTGSKSVSAYTLKDIVIFRSAALLEKPNGIAQNIAAKIIASVKPGFPLPALEAIKSVGLVPIVGKQLQDSTASLDWSKRVANLSDAAKVKNFQFDSVTKFQSAKNGMVIFDLNQTEGTDQCSSDLYLVATAENAQELRLVDSAFGEGLCGLGGEGSSGGVSPILYEGKPILLSFQEDGSNKIYEFLDVFGALRTSSFLTIEAHNAFKKSERSTGCKDESDCFSLSQINGLFSDFSAINTAPLLADSNGKKLEGLVTDQAMRVKTVALPALKKAWEKTLCTKYCVESKPQFPEPVVVDLDGKGQLAVVISETEDDEFTQTLLFAQDTTARWKDVNSIKVQDLSKDFKGYDFEGVVLDHDSDQPFARGAQIQLRINDKGSLRILRFGELDLGRSYSGCCALQELKLVGNKIEVVQKLEINPRAILDSVSVSAVGVPRERGN